MVTVSSSAELAAAIQKGSSIEVEPGKYYLTSVKASGSGLNISPFEDENPPTIYMSAKHPSGPMIRGSGLKDITFENVILDGNFANQPGATRGSSSLILVNLEGCSNINIIGNKVQNSAIDGFCLRSCHDILAEKNIVHDLGHEFVYCLSCYGGTFRDNNVKTRTNSAFRISYGGSGFDIHDNEIWSELMNWSTGPGVEVDKGSFKEIEIWNNSFKNLNGAGVWFCGNQAACSNVSVHDNTFDTVGQYYTTSGVYSVKYNGYSNGAITGAGFDGLVIEDNIFKNLKHCIVMSEAKHAISGNYAWNFNRNTISNCQCGYRIDQSRGSLVGSGNKESGIKTYSIGVTGNVKLTGTSDPVENTEDTKEIITALINVTDAEGKTGSQELKLTTSQEDPRTNGLALITCKLSQNGFSGSKNAEFPCNTDAPETIQATSATGTDLLVEVKLTRTNGQSGLVRFLLPMVTGTGTNELKIRTADGRYGTGALNIVLSEPEPEGPGGGTNSETPTTPTEDTNLGEFKCTVNLTCEDGRSFKTTATAQVTSVKATGTGKKIAGYFRLKDVNTGDELHVPFDGVLQKNLF